MRSVRRAYSPPPLLAVQYNFNFALIVSRQRRIERDRKRQRIVQIESISLPIRKRLLANLGHETSGR